MAFLDFIRNRNTSQQPTAAHKSQEQKPENAKQMYGREAAQEKAAEKPITPEVKAQADRAFSTINRGSESLESASRPAVPENAGSPTAQLQKQDHQDKTQAALSPTDSGAGETPSQEKEKAPEKTPQRTPSTLPRRPPSWER